MNVANVSLKETVMALVSDSTWKVTVESSISMALSGKIRVSFSFMLVSSITAITGGSLRAVMVTSMFVLSAAPSGSVATKITSLLST